ncbi:MAG TPA: hypothetical protein VM936_08490 [Pyrinomonadaceae bacterium]|nr:hypothetical protein [Pyrinomonadaceae bacterium]
MSKRQLAKFRVVCEGDGPTISLRAKAKDKYEAFEQVVVFLRSKGFDYRVVLVEQKIEETAAGVSAGAGRTERSRL